MPAGAGSPTPLEYRKGTAHGHYRHLRQDRHRSRTTNGPSSRRSAGRAGTCPPTATPWTLWLPCSVAPPGGPGRTCSIGSRKSSPGFGRAGNAVTKCPIWQRLPRTTTVEWVTRTTDERECVWGTPGGVRRAAASPAAPTSCSPPRPAEDRPPPAGAVHSPVIISWAPMRRLLFATVVHPPGTGGRRTAPCDREGPRGS